MNRIRVLIAAIVCIVLVFVSGAFVCAGQLDPLPNDLNVSTLHPEQTLSVEAKTGSGAQIILPGRGMVAIDFAVEGSKELLLMLLTRDQSSALAAGQQPDEGPLMRTRIKGTDSKYKLLDRGQYVIFIGNDAPTDTTLTYRVTWREK